MEKDAAPRKDFIQDLKTQRPGLVSVEKAWVDVIRNGVKGGVCYSSEVNIPEQEARAKFEEQKLAYQKDRDSITLELVFGGEVIEKWVKS